VSRVNRKDALWLVAAVGIFGTLDLIVYGLSPPTTGWAGPHAALLLQLSVDVSLLFLVRFPVRVASWALVVTVLMLVSEELAPGLLTPVAPARTRRCRSRPPRSSRTWSRCPTAAARSP
jgi:hypothetical protein